MTDFNANDYPDDVEDDQYEVTGCAEGEEEYDYDDSMDLSNSVYSDKSCSNAKPDKGSGTKKPPKKCNYAFDLKTGRKDICQDLEYSPPGSNL